MHNTRLNIVIHIVNYSEALTLHIFTQIVVLLYADDTVIFSESLECMQKALDIFQEYCNLWKLSVNYRYILASYFLVEQFLLYLKIIPRYEGESTISNSAPFSLAT
jgi:hypothetical protein